MIEARRKVVGCCGTLTEKARDAAIAGDIVEKIAAVAGDAREKQLVVPVVGAFSAGKSTLINNLLGDSVLPVDVRPETSLATELHYSSENYILAIKDDGGTDRYRVDEIKTVTAKAKDYLYAQLYLNNENLRKIEPLVLVDMPGFDSPLDLHNKAIMAYLNRGCHYIVLSSVEDGTITKSLERRLHEIDGFKRDFSFFLSKADLRPRETVNNLVAHYQDQLEARFDGRKKVAPFGMSADEVVRCLETIDVDTVFLNLYKDVLLVVCDDVIANINLQIKSAKNDGEKLRMAVAEMSAGVEKLKDKAKSNIDDMRRRYSGTFVNEISDDVSRALDGSLDELTGLALSGNQGALERCVNEIVRSALAASIREKLDGVSRQITIDLSESMSGLDRVMKDLELDENYLQNLTGKVSSTLMAIGDMVSKGQSAAAPVSGQSVAQAAGQTAVALAGTKAVMIGAKAAGLTAAGVGIATAASVAVPIIGLVVVLLPGIIKLFDRLINGSPEERQKAKIREKLTLEVFPDIKRKIRAEVPTTIEGHIANMIGEVRQQFEAQIASQEEAIKAQMEQESANVAEKEAARQKLETVRADVQNVASEIMVWGK